ncbi:MAG TPA: FHA domain-containing protein [Solirubrobacteraceae bacterium]|jgi:pSer/pThr/pTyr-binding forkhead associated (FHA) protein|nr:FHA domain-containing protein [Solirubrobacteraceae bacterium]
MTASVDPLERHTLTPAELQLLLAAERRGRAFLAFRDSAAELHMFDLPADGSAVVIGRRESASLCLPWDSRVSGVHAEVKMLGEEWTIVDDGMSKNGTVINAQRLIGRQRLRDQDRIRVGRTVIAFRDPAQQVTETVIDDADSVVDDLSDTQRRILLALCRPMLVGGQYSAPASNHTIALEVHLGVDAVKTNLRTMFARFGVDGLPQNQKRAKLAAQALRLRIVSERDI